MSVIAWIVIGLLPGWLATRIMGGRGGLMRNLAVGLVGRDRQRVPVREAEARGCTGFLGQSDHRTVGAVVFLLIWRAIRGA
jgi:uncharacterized membrane protein YeaQ/YmgE (transglycosylase-associated protein family)